MNFKDLVKIALSRSGIRNPFKSMFKVLEFETTAYCNRKCNYCPNVEFERFGEDENFLMSEKVFETLIGHLVDLKFNGLISPHLYGEPLSDHRMLDWVRYIKMNLPNSKIKIVTNGDYLSKNNFNDFLNAGADIFYISKHSKLLKKDCRDLLKDLNKETLDKHVLVQDFYSDFQESQGMFTNRGGSIEVKTNVKKTPVNCSYATYPVINSLGDLLLCCQDFHNNYVFGNIMDRHLRDIWFDERNISLRKNIYDYKLDLKICRDCKM
jgi:radical SAM protein with 4Fe4S-binding SPASM domain